MSPKDNWQQEAERLGGKQFVIIMTKMLDTQRDIIERLNSSDKRHEDFLKKAFPAGDFEGHSRYHQELIEVTIERKKLMRSIAEKTIGGMVWSAFATIGWLLYHGVIKVLTANSNIIMK